MQFLPADLFACYGTDVCARLIRAATCCPVAPRGLRLPPSHVAICSHDPAGTLRWWESTTLTDRPCLVQRRIVRGVQVHGIEERIGDYVRAGGRVALYRLVEIDALSPWEEQHLYRLLRRYCRRGTRYDVTGAALSGLRAAHLLRLLPIADDSQLFCSELIAAVLMRLGRMNRANPTLFNPGRLLRRLMWEGTYRREYVFDHLDQIPETTEGADVLPFRRAG